MTPKNDEAREFLASRRAKITPEMAGLPRGSGIRRVAGLRREEVAILAGVSVDYYTRIEKGDLSGVSDEILDAVAGALQLSDDETGYLYDLARMARRPERSHARARQSPARVPQSIRLLIDSMSASPVIAMSRRLDIVAANPLGRALYDVAFDSPTRRSSTAPPNLASFTFLDPAAPEFFDDRDGAAATCVRILRAQAGATPKDRQLTQLVGELCTRSEDFAARWSAHDVGRHRSGTKILHHHEVGRLELVFEDLTVESAPSLILSAYIAEPSSPTAERLELLATWSATMAAEAVGG